MGAIGKCWGKLNGCETQTASTLNNWMETFHSLFFVRLSDDYSVLCSSTRFTRNIIFDFLFISQQIFSSHESLKSSTQRRLFSIDKTSLTSKRFYNRIMSRSTKNDTLINLSRMRIGEANKNLFHSRRRQSRDESLVNEPFVGIESWFWPWNIIRIR